jgi:hypothetical protein
MSKKIIRINMSDLKATEEAVPDKWARWAGRGLTSAIVFDEVDPTCHPLGPNNKLVIAPGWVTGSPAAPSSGRTSFGAKSPLTGGIKESNAGGLSGQKMAKLGLAAIIIEGAPEHGKWYTLVVTKDGVRFEDASDLVGKGMYDVDEALWEKYPDTAVIGIGQAGEMKLSNAGISVNDPEGRPGRYAGRGGLGAVMGAAKVGAAPWRLGNASGMEAEIVLPKRENTRLWTGILGYGFHVLQFMVNHPKEDRGWFEPLATEIISSLRFPKRIPDLKENTQGVPLPPGYTPTDPKKLVEQISKTETWEAYAGDRPADALQAFYVREAPNFGWEIIEYRPFPQNVELGFARFHLMRAEGNGTLGNKVILGIMPYTTTDTVNAKSPANIVVRYD